MTIEEKILAKIIPTEEETARIEGIADRLKSKVQNYLDEHGIDAQLKLVGSFSKSTYLSNPDLDLFIMFPPGTPRNELEEIGLKIGEEVLHGTRMYAEHPYTSAVFEGVDVDLVPNIHIDSTDKLETAVDRTPFHTEYVLRSLKPGQNNQIRLLKKFMKGIGTYGAEPNVRGFSGYLCELLVLKYGSFEDALKAARDSWKSGTQIRLEAPRVKLEGPLVFYDPVDGKRNVASAVHIDTMMRFVRAATDYLEHPSEIFFFPPAPAVHTEEWINKKVSNAKFRLITVTFRKPDIVDDNLHSQLWRTENGILAKLEHFGFGPLRAAHCIKDEKMHMAFLLETDSLPATTKNLGPPAWVKTSANFVEKWEKAGLVKPFIENGRWCAIVPRQYTDAKQMLSRELQFAGIGREMDLDSAEIFSHEETLTTTDRGLLSDLLDQTPFWKNSQ